MGKVLFIGLVWPEPQSSAAGTRILQLVRLFQQAGDEIVFASAAAKSTYSFPLGAEGVREETIFLNDSRFDSFVADVQPDVVVFDRFMCEEQYGWRVREQVPAALTILDTEDLHFLRRARADAAKKQTPVDYHSATAMREIAAILRCDLSLIISRNEMELLIGTFDIPKSLLYYLPFLESSKAVDLSSALSFEQRQDFVFIGNFLHEPNWQTLLRLKTNIWPGLRQRFPGVALHIYGAYASDKVYQLHQPKDGFLIQGRAEDARETLGRYRVLLAPIPFGAGAKGKFVDAMQAGTPTVTTTVGAEGMTVEDKWNGFVEDDPVTFIDRAAFLYQEKKRWYDAQAVGRQILHTLYDKAQFETPFLQHICQLCGNLQAHRQKHFIGQILHTQQHNSSKYMALWIAEKNK